MEFATLQNFNFILKYTDIGCFPADKNGLLLLKHNVRQLTA